MLNLDRGRASLLAMVMLALLAGTLFANVMYVNAHTTHKRSLFEPEVHPDGDRVTVLDCRTKCAEALNGLANA